MGEQADAEFTDFMTGTWPRLVRLGYVLTGDHGIAEDLAQTVLSKAYASWPRVRRAGDPEAYVRKMIVNASRDRFRRRRVAELLTDSLPEARAGEAADALLVLAEREALLAALMSLPAGQRAAVVLRYWLDLTETEAASMLGCSVGNVKSQASRALAKLRLSDELAGLADEVSHDDR